MVHRLFGLNGVHCIIIYSLLLVLSRRLVRRSFDRLFVTNKLLSMGYGRRRYD